MTAKIKQFSSAVKRVYNDKRVVIFTEEWDDFGTKRYVENIITIEQAKETLENLKHTIEQYESDL